MNAEEIMNSGKLYKAMELTDEQDKYHSYLQIMEEYDLADRRMTFITITANRPQRILFKNL